MSTLITFNKEKKTGVIYFPKNKIVRKFTIKKKNYKLIKNEIKGISWYQSKQRNIYKKPKIIIESKKNNLDIKIINGKQIKFWTYLEENFELAKLVIYHYKNIWPNKKIVPCHGDLTFSNIIFKKDNQPQIIDWENFLINKMNWGFDLSYFLISTVSLPSITYKEKKIKEKELFLLSELWIETFKNKKYKYLNKPVNFLKSSFGKTFILRNYSNYYPNLISSYKTQQINEALKINI